MDSSVLSRCFGGFAHTAFMSSMAVRYHLFSRVLHALLGLLLVGMFAVGLYMSDLSFAPERLKLYNGHKWAGVVVLTLSLVRLLWRQASPPPKLAVGVLVTMPPWQRRAYGASHVGLYLLFLRCRCSAWPTARPAVFPWWFSACGHCPIGCR